MLFLGYREDTSYIWYQIVRDVLFGSRENVNFVHEIFRQAFLLPFNCSPAIRRTIAVHKDWIQMNVCNVIFIENIFILNLSIF